MSALSGSTGPPVATQVHGCSSCGDPSSKRCTGCSKVWYCSTRCQKGHWRVHIVDCNPRRPITTADYLGRAVALNLSPEDPQTLIDYGFARAWEPAKQANLLGLYIGLVERIHIKPTTIHKWRVEGRLVEEIKTTFEAIPPKSRGGYYPWFLENQYVLDDSNLDESELARMAEDSVLGQQLQAWRFIGGSSSFTPQHVDEEVSSWPDEKRTCFLLYSILLARCHPSPGLNLGWVQFGFCVYDANSEMELSLMYTKLIRSCTFDAFCAAYTSSSLFTLMKSKGLSVWHRSDELEHVLKGSPYVFESVWHLKQMVLRTDDDPPMPSIAVDYGFMNCQNPGHSAKLKDVYRRVLDRPSAQPLELHKACIEGRLFEYVRGQVEVPKGDRKLLHRLMKNPYPLPDL